MAIWRVIFCGPYGADRRKISENQTIGGRACSWRYVFEFGDVGEGYFLQHAFGSWDVIDAKASTAPASVLRASGLKR